MENGLAGGIERVEKPCFRGPPLKNRAVYTEGAGSSDWSSPTKDPTDKCMGLENDHEPLSFPGFPVSLRLPRRNLSMGWIGRSQTPRRLRRGCRPFDPVIGLPVQHEVDPKDIVVTLCQRSAHPVMR